MWAIAFDPERGRPIGAPYALTQFSSPSFGVVASGLNVFERNLYLPMRSATGHIWTLDNVDR